MQIIINNKEKIKECPVPVFWKTNPKGNIYVYDKYWKKLIKIIQNNRKFNITRSEISKSLQIDNRLLRRWSNEGISPRIYTKEEFTLSLSNLNNYSNKSLNFEEGIPINFKLSAQIYHSYPYIVE